MIDRSLCQVPAESTRLTETKAPGLWIMGACSDPVPTHGDSHRHHGCYRHLCLRMSQTGGLGA